PPAARELDIERRRKVALVEVSYRGDERSGLRGRAGGPAPLAVREAKEEVGATHDVRVFELRPVAAEHTVRGCAPVRPDDGKVQRDLGLSSPQLRILVATDAGGVDPEVRAHAAGPRRPNRDRRAVPLEHRPDISVPDLDPLAGQVTLAGLDSFPAHLRVK